MSLINDALKRAKQAQQENPPTTPALEFRPVEPGQKENRRTTLLVVGLALVLIALVGLAGALVWFVSQSKPAPVPVAARVADVPLAPVPQPVAVTPTNPVAQVSSQHVAETIESPEEPNTNGIPVVAAIVAVVQPPALKLQGIFFSPSNPSAVVNGKTVYLGERVNGFRLLAVSPVAITLASATETNVLSLSDQ